MIFLVDYINKQVDSKSTSFLLRIRERRDSMSKYYYHGIQGNYFGMKKALKILTTGGIKCKRLLNQENFVGYNGLDYVSICKKEREVEYFHSKTNGFYSFVQCNFCFIISDTIDAVKTEMPDFLMTQEALKEYESTRFSDMFDEWQVREEIPLKFIVGIGIPLSELRILFEMQPTLGELQELKEILRISEALGIDIVDSSELHFVESYESQKEEGKRIAIKVNL